MILINFASQNGNKITMATNNLKINSLPPDFDINERVFRARENFRLKGYNCCQSVLLAYTDVLGIDEDTAATVTSGFGGGMGRLREVCGSVSAMSMIAGFIHPAADPLIKTDRTANYALVQEAASEFRQINGSIICKELLGLVPKSTVDKNGIGIPAPSSAGLPAESPEPSDRTPEYYRKRPCEELIGISARIIGEIMLRNIPKADAAETGTGPTADSAKE